MTQEKSDTSLLYENLTVETLPGSQVQLMGEIPLNVVSNFRELALITLGKDVDIPGFRKGHVPQDVLEKRLGELEILREIASDTLSQAYPQMIEQEKLDVIGRPDVSITKLAPGNPIGFTITSAVMPEVKLPDYKKIAAGHQKEKIDPKDIEVQEEEIQNVISDIRKREAFVAFKKENPDDTEKQPEDMDEKEWPELTDEMVQQLGDFKNVDDFTTKIRANMERDKEHQANEKRRGKLADALVEGSTIDVPEVVIESELANMLGEFKTHVMRLGLTYEAYLEKTGKNEEELSKEWRPDATRRAKLQLVLNEIAKKEEIVPDEKIVEREIAHITEHYPEAKEEQVRAYVSSVQTNDLVFKMLENKEDKKEK